MGRATLAAALAMVPLLGACGSKQAQTPASTTTTHDSVWIDAAIAQVGIAAGHDPVVRVEIDPDGATVTTRKPDSRVQRSWRVPLATGSPSAAATASPSATHSPSRTPSSSPSRTPSATSASSTPKRTPTPVFPRPSGATATPLAHVKVDNTGGNMSLGSFGDIEVQPMWTQLKQAGCTMTGWQIVATAGWSGSIVSRGTCRGTTETMVGGELLPASRSLHDQLVKQLAVLNALTPNQVVRLDITRTGNAKCPTTMSADYAVNLGGTLQARTLVTCTTVTTTTLSNGWLPSAGFAVSDVHAEAIEAAVKDLAAHKQTALSTSLRVQWSGLYQQVVIAPASVTSGRPTYGLDGVRKK